MEGVENIKYLMRRFTNTTLVRAFGAILLIIVLLLWGFKACSGGQGTKVYRIARNTTWPALDLLGKEPNMLGFLDELVRNIAENEKIVISLVTLTQQNLMDELNAGIFDGVLLALTPDPLTHEYYDISDPIFVAGPVLIVRASSPTTSLKTIQGNTIGIKSGSPFLFRLNQNPNLTFVPYENMFSALEDVVSGRLAGVIMEAQMANTYISSFYKNQLKIVGSPLSDLSIRLIAHWDKNGEFLIEHFNRGLDKLHKDGTYDELIKKWAFSK
jgi:ABC-type amino acid transport substrate-binding protein